MTNRNKLLELYQFATKHLFSPAMNGKTLDEQNKMKYLRQVALEAILRTRAFISKARHSELSQDDLTNFDQDLKIMKRIAFELGYQS